MSTSNPYKFSLTEDPNDSGMLQKALDRLSFQDPGSFGGQFYEQDPTQRLRQIAQFATHVPPDITSDTHIIAVLGTEQTAAMPQSDGWFVSDFFAFWHLLHGTTKKNQTWLHALDLDKLIDDHKEYLHGSPYKERKVVLNRALLNKAQDKNSKDSITKIQPRELKKEFRNRLVAVCKAAAAANENVILLVFAHGNFENYGIILGERIGSELYSTLPIKTLAKELRGINAKIYLISTACFSGGWCCRPDLQFTAFTAAEAGKTNVSSSWATSGSSGRFCGSMFASNIAGCLTQGWLSENDHDNLTQVQGMSLAALDTTVHRSLLEMHDRRGYEHYMSFSAQDDAWSMHWQQRTGVPLANFAKRWNDLPNYPKDPTLHPGDPLNRDPQVPQAARDDYQRLKKAHVTTGGGQTYFGTSNTGDSHSAGSQNVLGKRKASSLYGGSIDAMRNQVVELGRQYLQTNASMTDAAENHRLHILLENIICGKENRPQEFESALMQLEYRMFLMFTADRYLELMDIPYPNGQQCYEYDQSQSWRWTSPDPEPVENQGNWFSKGANYLGTAFAVAGLPKDVVQQKLDALVAIIKKDIDEQCQIVKEIPEVKTKRQNLWQVLEKVGNMSPVKSRSRSTSPTKRRSRGQSLG